MGLVFYTLFSHISTCGF